MKKNKQKQFETLQLLYSGLLADAVLVLEKHEILRQVIKQNNVEQILSAPAKVRQFDLKTPEDVFSLYSELFGFAEWEKQSGTPDKVFKTDRCKLKSISKAGGEASPCELCCINPVKALCGALDGNYKVQVLKTLWEDNECIFAITPSYKK